MDPFMSLVCRACVSSEERLINGMFLFETPSNREEILLNAWALALCHLSGWSGDRIAAEIKKKASNRSINGNDCRQYHRMWMVCRGVTEEEEEVKQEEIEVMLRVAREFGGIEFVKIGTPLYTRPPVPCIVFCPIWAVWQSPNDGQDLCQGYNVYNRKQTERYFLGVRDMRAFGAAAPLEAPVIRQLDNEIRNFMKETLHDWTQDLRVALREIDSDSMEHRSVSQVCVDLLKTHVAAFRDKYEEVHGEIVGYKQDTRDRIVSINDVGIGCFILMQEMLLDRARSLFRMIETEGVHWLLFKLVDLSQIPEESRDCPICKERMWEKTPEGDIEHAVQLVGCCGQFFGLRCLKQWLSSVNTALPKHMQVPSRECPNCRHRFQQPLLDMLFQGEPPEVPEQVIPGSPLYTADVDDEVRFLLEG